MKKICIKCNTEKELDEYPQYKARSGEYRYRNVCRDCFNKQDRVNRKTVTRREPVIYAKADNDLTTPSMFTDAEIAVLKQIVKERIKLNTDMPHSKRVIKSFNIEEALFDLVVEHAKSKNVSNSDVLNKILQEFFNKD